MNILIIYAHPSDNSFSKSLLETCINESRLMGHQVEIRDLYAINFDPVLKSADFASSKAGSIPIDIFAEQKLIQKAELLMFIYPIWWGGMPAVLKGYIDRIFLQGFAYIHNETIHQGLLEGKKTMVFCTQGTSLKEYEENGMTEAMMRINDTAIFEFCGLESLSHRFYVQNSMTDRKSLDVNLQDVRHTVKSFLWPVFQTS